MDIERFAKDEYDGLQDQIRMWLSTDEAFRVFNGKMLPSLPLSGDVDPTLVTALNGAIAAEGISLHGLDEIPKTCPCGRPDCPNNAGEKNPDNMYGAYLRTARPDRSGFDHAIYLRDDMSPLQRTKTEAHELAHFFLSRTIFADYLPEVAQEFVVEAAAYILMRQFGYDTGTQSVPYVGFHGAFFLENFGVPIWFPQVVVNTIVELLDAVERQLEDGGQGYFDLAA